MTIEEVFSKVLEGDMSFEKGIEEIVKITSSGQIANGENSGYILEKTSLLVDFFKSAIGEADMSETPEDILKDLISEGEIDAEGIASYVAQPAGYALKLTLLKKYKDELKIAGDILGEVTDVVDFVGSLNAIFRGKDYATKCEGFIDLIETAYSAVPVLGSIVGIQCAVAKACLSAALAVRDQCDDKGMSKGLLTDFGVGDIFGSVFHDDQVYKDFNAFLKETYSDDYGTEYVEKLYIDKDILTERLGSPYNIANLYTTDLFFMASVAQLYPDRVYFKYDEYIFRHTDVDNMDDLSHEMDEFCDTVLRKYRAIDALNAAMRIDLDNMLDAMEDAFGDVMNGGGSGSPGSGGPGSGGSGSGGSGSGGSGSGGSGSGGSGSGGSGSGGSGSGGSGSGGSGSGGSGSGGSGSGGSGSGGSGSGGSGSGGSGSEDEVPSDDGDPSAFRSKYTGDMGDAESAQVRRVDPLIFDLNNDGIFSTTVEDGVHFDYEADGFKEKTAWMSEGDGMLVRDINGNGTIDNGSELFGDQTLLSNGDVATNGIDALTDLDSNNDSVINADDEFFSELRVWTDTNRDGISQADELHTLAELGIKEISLTNDGTHETDANNNVVSGMLYATYENGETVDVAELDFTKNTVNTTIRTDVVIDDDVMELPEIYGFGEVYTLRQAMSMNDELKTLVKEFIDTKSHFAKMQMMDRILAVWTGSQIYVKNNGIYNASGSGSASNSRGSFIDAGHLEVLEKFYGAKFNGVNGANPNSVAAGILNNLYSELKYHMYANLIFKTEGLRYFDKAEVGFDGKSTSGIVNMELLASIGKYHMLLDAENTKDTVRAMAYCINDTKIYSGKMQISDLLNIFSSNSELFDSVCRGIAGASYETTEDKTNISGDENANYMKGTQESNTLSGGAGNDIFVTTGAESMFYGGAGNDIFVIGKNSGIVTINDTVGSNRLYFDKGITANDLTVSTAYRNDLTINIAGCDTKVVLSNFRYNSNYRKFEMEFSDGTIMSLDDVNSPFRHVVGSAEDDTVYANYYTDMTAYAGDGNDTISGSGGADVYYGEAGNDTLYGYDGADKLYGGAGDDNLQGGAGDDLIVGGVGNYKLYGHDGADVFVIGKNTGTDIIYD
ncbi:MAG: hypothetical protein IJB96_06185, partial [Lachnospira sp.]|nr:hypothetical protein [Lachnospira sp.]